MTDTIIDVTPEPVQAPATEAQAGPLITVQDLFTVVKLLEDLARKELWNGVSRLSETEIAHVKPAFDKIVAFLAEYERQVNATAAPSVLEAETNLLDLNLGEEASATITEVLPTPKKAKKPAKVEAVVAPVVTPAKKSAKKK